MLSYADSEKATIHNTKHSTWREQDLAFLAMLTELHKKQLIRAATPLEDVTLLKFWALMVWVRMHILHC